MRDYRLGCGNGASVYSAEAAEVFEKVFSNITRRALLSGNESETSAVFEQELYYAMRSEFGVELEIRKERPVDGVAHTFGGGRVRRGQHGRLDAVVNNLVIEYKHFSKLEKEGDVERACAQVEDYLTALHNDEQEKYDAILTDGLRVAYFSYMREGVVHTPLRRMTVNDIRTIVSAIQNNHTKKIDPQNIVNDFSIHPLSPSRSGVLAKTLYDQLSGRQSEKTSMLFAEWQSLIHLSVDDNGKSADIEKRRRDLSALFGVTIDDNAKEYRALYSLHTTFAIIVKLMAYKVLEESAGREERVSVADMLSDDMRRFFQRMEDGMVFRGMGIRNLLEGDFFSWYADEDQWSDAIWDAVRPIIGPVEEYSAFSLNVRYNPVDVFKDLYMGIIPQSVRHSMGEYFTPEWLANSVIESALQPMETREWRAIDPCCGSGIFIVSLIKEIVGEVEINDLTDAQRVELVHGILQRVHGIDINPLSVLAARVGYYLAISQLGPVRNIEIPVYLGDSALVPTTETVDGIICYSYDIHTLKDEVIQVTLPKRLVGSTGFGDLMDDVQAMVNVETEESIIQILGSRLTAMEKKSALLQHKIQGLAHSLVMLHRNHWDGIWVRILANYMNVARMGDFDVIVGNPPWVKWEHLPAAYTRRIKAFCDIRHIFCNDGGMFGGAQLNICALISNVVASSWLKRGGVLAFLMPDSIMSQNSYEEFRNFYTDYSKRERLYLNKIDRWKAPLRPFKVGKKSIAQDFNTYFYSSRYTDYRQGVPVREISKRRGVDDRAINACKTWEDAKEYLTIAESVAKQLSPQSTAFTYISGAYDFQAIIGESAYHYRTGVESTPFEVFKLLGVGESVRGRSFYRFKNKQLKASRYKVMDIPPEGWDFSTRYIYPIVEGPSVKAFEFDTANNYHIIPYDEDNTSTPVPMATLYSRCPELARYFMNHKSLLDQQSEKSKVMHRGSDFYALSKIGPYTFAPYIVAARDNSDFCSSVIGPTLTPWGELKQSICVKHTIIISQGTDGHFITEDEAHYINGILNSRIVKAYIHCTFKTNGFSLKKSHIYLPGYDETDAICREISDLSKRATADSTDRETVMKELTRAYLQLCDSRNRR